MNFFESQDRVRKHTAWLVFLFVLAVLALILMTNLLVMLAFGYLSSQQMQGGGALLRQMDWQSFTMVSLGVGGVVLAGSLYKIMQLSAGGKAVAESLGGQRVPQDTNDPGKRKLLNVVEEMAIASGTPPPPVYLLEDEPGINAFAAGFSPRDAVIGVTRGTLDHLNREQLQGVIAHEFSHIFNGDMRLNIRLMGVLNGILVLGMIGYYILRSTAYAGRGRRSNKSAGGILALGLGLMVVGFAGTFFGGLIKSAVSRQREYLADASAVQFTRNPDGIAGALKRIGGLEFGSRVENPGAPEISHAFFAQGVSGLMQALSATHPPLSQRIKRIDPGWDGRFLAADAPDRDDEAASQSTAPDERSREALAQKMAAVMSGVAVADVANAIERIGNPGQDALDHARDLIDAMPARPGELARDPFGARAVVYLMVLDKAGTVRTRQLKHLQDYADPAVYALIRELLAEMDSLDVGYRLPLLDRAIPSLKQLSLGQYKTFRSNLRALVEMDSRLDLLEWSLQKILFNHLEAHFFKLTPAGPRYTDIRALGGDIQQVLSIMAHAGQSSPDAVNQAFQAAARVMETDSLTLVAKDSLSLASLDRALDRLARLSPLLKPRVLKACVASIENDGKILPVEIEMLRAFADVIDCPMPPVAAQASSPPA